MAEEILDFEEAVDFNLSDNPDAVNNELLDESMFDLDGTMDFSIDEQLDKVNVDTDAQDKTGDKEEDKKENKEENKELDNSETILPPEEDPEELKLGLDDEFDMDDPDFLKDFGEVNSGLDNDGNLEDDEFWKEFGLDQQDDLDKEGENDSRTGKSTTPEKLETDNTIIASKSSQKENTLSSKKFASSDSDAAKSVKIDSKKSSSSTGKSAPNTKSPEKEDGEIPNSTTSSADNNRQGQQQKQKQQPQSQQPQPQQVQSQKSTQQRSSHQRQLQPPSNHHNQQNNQSFRGRGMRRNNDWRSGNEFFNGNMPSFRSGFGPGIEGMPGMPIGQMPMGNPIIPSLNMSGPMIGPNIHVNPNFARLRPHALPFANQMGQFPPMGSGGPPMNMMPFQSQMDISPFHPSMAPIGGGGRGNNNSFSARSGNPAFNHHNALPSRRMAGQQPNNQNPRTAPSSLPKRKTPVDGFEQKEPATKKNTTNGKSVVSETKPAAPTAAAQKAVDRTKPAPPINTGKTPSAPSEKNSKSGIPTSVNTNINTTTTKLKPSSVNTTSASSSSTTSTSSSKPNSKLASRQIQKTATAKAVSKPAVKTSTFNSSTQATSQEKSTANTNSGKTAAGSNKLTISNVDESVTKRDLQTLASTVPGGFSLITLDRTAHSAEITFKTVEGAKLFRRIHNRSQLGGSNIVINFS